jgi:hypothetical protein
MIISAKQTGVTSMAVSALLALCWPSYAAGFDLTKAAFDAFVTGETQRLSALIMTEARYRSMTGGKDVGMTETEYEERIEEASKRANYAAQRTFRLIRRLLVGSGFDWTSAKLRRVEVKVRDPNTGTRRAPFDPKSTEQRLDIVLIVASGEKAIELRLDDCFLVDGARYLGDGFKLDKCSGFELNEVLLNEIEALEDQKSTEPDGTASGSQPSRSETNRTSSAAGSRR